MIELAEKIMDKPKDYAEYCKGRQLATLFYEPSTRTRLSFTSAMYALGGSVLGFSDEQSTSVSKGETVADTTRIISSYADMIVMRHYKEGSAMAAAQYASVPVINAGDGSHAHPTQTLTDLLTIHKELGRLDQLTIGLCGDLKYGRTVHSLIKAMSDFEGIHFVLIAHEILGLPEYMLQDLEANPQLSYSVASSLEDVMGELDVLYMTRVQRERFDDMTVYERCRGCFILTPEIMRSAKEKMIVLHPLPRLDEIAYELDDDPRAAYFRQARNGKFIRMSLICQLLDAWDEENTTNKEPFSLCEILDGREISGLKYPLCPNERCITATEVLPYLTKVQAGEILCAYCETNL